MICTECGTKENDIGKFCKNCGTKLIRSSKKKDLEESKKKKKYLSLSIKVLIFFFLSSTILYSSIEYGNYKSNKFDETYKEVSEKLNTFELMFDMNEQEGVDLQTIGSSLQKQINSIYFPSKLQQLENDYVKCTLETYTKKYTKEGCQFNFGELTNNKQKDRMGLYSKLKIYRTSEYKKMDKEKQILLIREITESLETLYLGNYGNAVTWIYPSDEFVYFFNYLDYEVKGSSPKHDPRPLLRNEFFSLLINLSAEFYKLGLYKECDMTLGDVYPRTSGYLEEINTLSMNLSLLRLQHFDKEKTKENLRDLLQDLSYGVSPYYYNEEFANIMANELKIYFLSVVDTSDYNFKDYENVLGHLLESKHSKTMKQKSVSTDTTSSLDFVERVINNIGFELLNKGKYNDAVKLFRLNYLYNVNERFTRENLIVVGYALYYKSEYNLACNIFQGLYVDEKTPKEQELVDMYFLLTKKYGGTSTVSFCSVNSKTNPLKSSIGE